MRKIAWLMVVAFVVGLLVQRFGSDGRESNVGIVSSAQSVHDVLYLELTPSTGILKPTALSQELGAVSVSTWSAVESQDQSNPIDALIVDSGSFASVNWSWVSARLSRGLIIIGLNVPLTSMVPLLANTELTVEHTDWLSEGAYPADHNAEYFSIALAPVYGVPAARTAIAQDPSYDGPAGDCMSWSYYVNEDSTVTPRTGIPTYVFSDIRNRLDRLQGLEVNPCDD